MKIRKKIIVGILGVTCASLGVIGALSVFSTNANFVKAEAVGMTVDTLGNLEWNEVKGATGYSWSYSINGGASFVSGGSATENSANVKEALKAAAGEAKALNTDADDGNDVTQASVAFSVTPVLEDGSNGTVQEYTYSFTQYIDYDYTMTDISEYMVADKMTLPNYDKPFSDVKFFKNDILTFSLYADTTETNTSLYRIAFGGEGKGNNSTTNNYRFQFSANSDNDRICLAYDKSMSCGNVTLYSQTYYYYSLAVFDTYNLSGESIGETVYLQASTYNEATKKLDEYFVNESLFTTSDIETARTAGSYFGWNDEGDKIVISTYSGNTNKINYLGTGDLSKVLSLQANFTVDELGILSWNDIDGATGYRVSYPLGSGIKTVIVNASVVDVNEALKYAAQQAKALNMDTNTENDVSLAVAPFTIVPITTNGGGVALHFKHTFEQYLNYQDTYDITESGEVNEQKISGTRVDYYKNYLMTFGVRSDIAPLYQIAVGGVGGENTSNYFIRLWASGVASWRVKLAGGAYQQKTSSAIQPNENGYLKLGVFDTYNFMGEIIGETVYISHEAYDYATDELQLRKVFTWFFDQTSIDAKKTEGSYTEWTEAELENGETVQTAPLSFGMHSSASSPNTYIFDYNSVPSLATKNYTVYIVKGDEILGTETGWKYGKPYDFSAYETRANKAGYAIDHWTISYGEQIQTLEKTGAWEYDSTTGIAVIEPVYVPIDYQVSYDVQSSNPATYNIESSWALTAPTSIPAGKVFDAWYMAEDTDFSHPLTTLTGKTGDLQLVARFINGYTITVDGVEYDWMEGDDAFILTAPAVFGKTFSKWQVLSGNEYVDYTGEATFTPNRDMSFKAVYEWNAYFVTYSAEGATHDNVASYTGENVVTFKVAAKEGHFFLGWYKEPTFETLVENTQGYAENLTLYAKFTQNKIPAELVIAASQTAQSLPVPELPEGAQYHVALYSGQEPLSLTDNTYTFDTAGTYTVKYSITLPTGETVNCDISLTVEQLYTVNVYYGDGEMLTLQVKTGEKLTEEDIPQPPEGVPFGGLYTDYKFTSIFDLNTAITEDTNIYVKWGIDESEKSNLGWIIGGIVGGSVVLMGAGAAVFFILKKKSKK